MNLWKRFTGHLKTVVKHKNTVLVHCIKAGIFWQGIRHDLSKFSPTEFIPGVKYFQGYRSPNEGEREDIGYSTAWLHHKGRNKHHFEYWSDIDFVTKELTPIKMPLKYVAEMFCDRVAASKIYKKADYRDTYPLEYYNLRRDHRDIHPDTAALLEKLLTMLAESGEDETFAYIRKLLKDAGGNDRTY